MVQKAVDATGLGSASGDRPRGVRRAARAAGSGMRAVRNRLVGATRDAGMATAEYAIVMIAAVGFAGLLVIILRSAEIRDTLTSLVRGALSV